MEERKRRYETKNDHLWNLETIIDTVSRHQAESFRAILSNLDALLRNSIDQEKTVSDKTEKQPGTSVDFLGPQRTRETGTYAITSDP